MANIIIGTSQQMGSASIAGSSEASAATAVGNLLTRDPSERWRVSDLATEQYAQLQLDTPRRVNFAAIAGLRTTQTTQNHLRSNAALDGANWTRSNLTAAAGSTTDPLGFSNSFDLTATGGPATHDALQSCQWTYEGTATLAMVVWARQVAGSAHIKFQIDNGGGSGGTQAFDLANGTLNATGSGSFGSGTLVDSSIEADGSWYRCSIAVSMPRISGDNARIVINVLNSSFASSYTAGSEEIEVAYPMLTFVREGSELADAPTEPENNGTVRAAVGWFEFDDGSANKVFSPMLYAGSAAGRKTPHSDRRGRVMAYFRESLIPCSWCRAYIDDPDNEFGYFEAARFIVDRAWQPPGNYLPGATHGLVGDAISRVTESGAEYRRSSPDFRRFEGTLDFETEEAMFEYLMEQQEHAGLAGDVLVIPDIASRYYDTQAVWGYWEELPNITHSAVGIWQSDIAVKGIG